MGELAEDRAQTQEDKRANESQSPGEGREEFHSRRYSICDTSEARCAAGWEPGDWVMVLGLFNGSLPLESYAFARV